MKKKQVLLVLLAYSFAATLSVFYGLVEKRSLFVTFVAFHLLVCLLVPLLHAWWEGELSVQWKKAWKNDGFSGISYGLAVGAMLFIGIITGAWLLLQGQIHAVRIRQAMETWGLTSQLLLPFSLYLVLINSLLEELMWRGFILERLLSTLTRFQAVLLSSFFYSLYHLIIGVVLFGLVWGALITGLVFMTGALWGWMKRWYPSVYATWLSHLLADLGIVVVLYSWVY
ncbi:CPBP family intramembrane metalloprotease [Brevibacillus ruminantium]|uniref:CPBP family intramembrane metalloprotease n=1 Tax=Brevibacillus ruminantium TaxID=2950604 RepID=A0ABY4WKG0_9BACL|nr:type II CAAX endopeptidase family protein [Brevibacillus ruminantium]USG67640.1 CPBP family intramembrane metalloprotease [Brevibacillus ruminantium]